MALALSFCHAARSQAASEKLQWPLTPTYVLDNTTTWIRPGPIDAPVASVPQPDPLSLSAATANWQGLFAYVPVLQLDKYNQVRYFVLKSSNSSAQLNGKPSQLAAYRAAEGDDNNLDPLFSPDRKHLLFKHGDLPWAHPSYMLYDWDFTKREVIQVSDRTVFFPQFCWSPDSKKVAFVHGGDAAGDEDNGSTALTVYDLAKKGETLKMPHPVLQGDSSHDHRELQFFSWADASTLLFSQIRKAGKPVTSESEEKPSIYEADVRTGKVKLVVADGYAPLASPDNQWVAYMGWPKKIVTQPVAQSGAQSEAGRAKKTRTAPAGRIVHPALCLFNRKSGEVTRLDAVRTGSSPLITLTNLAFRWTPDSRSLVIVSSQMEFQMKRVVEGGRVRAVDDGVFSVVDFDSVDIASVSIASVAAKGDSLKKIKTVRSRTSTDNYRRPFQVTRISRDGRYLFVKKNEYNAANWNLMHEVLQAVDLASGEVQDLAIFTSPNTYTSGWDWYDEASPIAAASK